LRDLLALLGVGGPGKGLSAAQFSWSSPGFLKSQIRKSLMYFLSCGIKLERSFVKAV